MVFTTPRAAPVGLCPSLTSKGILCYQKYYLIWPRLRVPKESKYQRKIKTIFGQSFLGHSWFPRPRSPTRLPRALASSCVVGQFVCLILCLRASGARRALHVRALNASVAFSSSRATRLGFPGSGGCSKKGGSYYHGAGSLGYRLAPILHDTVGRLKGATPTDPRPCTT